MKITIKTHIEPAVINCPVCEKGKFSVWAIRHLKGNNSVCAHCGTVIEVLEDTFYDK